MIRLDQYATLRSLWLSGISSATFDALLINDGYSHSRFYEKAAILCKHASSMEITHTDMASTMFTTRFVADEGTIDLTIHKPYFVSPNLPDKEFLVLPDMWTTPCYVNVDYDNTGWLGREVHPIAALHLFMIALGSVEKVDPKNLDILLSDAEVLDSVPTMSHEE